jgi:predicted ATPase
MEKVRGFGGVLVQHAVSLLTWVFGLPHALDQLPLRAVHGALAIRQMVAEAESPDLGPCPDVRLAVHFGGILVDSQARPLTAHVLAVGETLAFPVRLLGHAVPGEILVSPQVGRLVAGSVALELRRVRLRAKHAELVGSYAVIGVNPGRAPRHGGVGYTRGVFVGREHEVALLEAVVEQVTAGRGQVVGLVGPPGMGKSRLLAAVSQRLATQQIPYVEGRCLAYGRATPYLPVLDLLRDYCGITEDDRPITLTEKVSRKLQQAGLDAEDSLPALLHLLGAPVRSAPFAALSAAMRKAQTFEILRHLFLKGGQQTPLALAVENLQWIDPTSEAFLTSLVASLAGVPLLFLGTYHPGYRPPWLDRSYVTQIVLQPLGHEASRAVISGVLHSTMLAPEIEQHMLTQAEGNPFFLEEFAHTVVEQSAQQPRLVIPETIHAVLAARIDHLSPEEKSLVQAAAVIGKDFSQPVLQAITALPEETLRQSLSQLQAVELLAMRSFAPVATYTFKHLLIQEAAYQSLPTSLRQQYHHQVAQVFVAQSPLLAETQPERIAHHYTEAGATALAIPYWQRASRRAVERSAHAEALSHLTNGLALIKTLPMTLESTQQELDLQVTLGSALAVTKGYTTPEVGHAYARAHELCGHVEDASQRLPVLLGLWRFYAGRAEFQPARELEEELLTLAQQLHDPTGLTWAHFAVGATLLRQGELARARIHLEQGIAVYDPQHYAASAVRYEQNPDAACRVAVAAVLWLLGYPDQALQRIQQTLPLAQGPADRFTLANTRFYAAWVYYALRQVDAVLAQTEAAMTVARAQGFTLFLELSTILHGWALATQGQRDEGIAHMQHSVATYRAADAVMHQPWYLELFAEVYAQGGQIAAGLDAVTEALATAETTGERYWEAELYRRQGELLLLQAEAGAQTGVAEACFQQALDIARRQQARSLELRAAMSLSRLWQRQGKWATAQHLLAAVYGWFTEGFDTVDVQEAKVLLDALSHR